MAQTLFRQWFVEEADEGWETSTISDEFDFTMGQSPPGDSYNEKGIGVPMFSRKCRFLVLDSRKIEYIRLHLSALQRDMIP